jgi:hypothetical protein
VAGKDRRGGVGLAWVLVGVVGACLAAALMLLTLAGTAYSCIFENTECADSETPVEFRGRLFDHEGRPASHVLRFRSDLYGRDFQADVETDSAGRFCVRALEGEAPPSIGVSEQRHVTDIVVRSSAPVDQRFALAELRERLRRRHPYSGPDHMAFLVTEPANLAATQPSGRISPSGAHDASALWDPRTDRAADCEELDDPPWYKFEHASGQPEFAVLMAAPLGALGLFALGVAAGLSGRRRRSNTRVAVARRAFQGSALGAALCLLLFVQLWSIV